MLENTFGDRLKQARLEKGLTQKQLASLVDVAHNTVSGWEKNKNFPGPDLIERLCLILDMSPNYLLGIPSSVDAGFSVEEKALIKKYRRLDTHGRRVVDTVTGLELQRLEEAKEEEAHEEAEKVVEIERSSLKASAGRGYWLEERPQDHWLVRYNSTTRRADMCLDITGDSMEPEFSDGDTVLIRYQPAIEEGQIGLYIWNGEGYIKRQGRGCIEPTNSKYPNIFPTEQAPIRCIGLVVGKLLPEWIVRKDTE